MVTTATKQHFVYLLSNRHKNVVYVGHTKNLKQRMSFHKKKLIPGFSKKYNVDRLVYFEVYEDKQQAVHREKQLKGYRREKKNELIRRDNPMWADLYHTIPR